MTILSLTLASVFLSIQTPSVKPRVTAVVLPQSLELGQELPPIALTADEASLIALEKNPKLHLARAALHGARGNTIQVRSGLLPKLSLSSSATDTDTIKSSSNSSNSSVSAGGTTTSGSGSGGAAYSATLSLTQLIFDFGHTLALTRQAMANEKAAFHGLSRAGQDAVFLAKTAYYLFSLNASLVGVQEVNVTDRQAQLDLAQARFAAGSGEPSDVLAAQTNFAAAVQQLVLARSAALNARIALAVAIGIDPRTPITTMVSTETPLPTDFSTLYAEALKSRPDLLQSIQQLRAAGYEVEAARTNNAPSLSLNAGYSGRGTNNIDSNQSATIGLGLTWAIFDGLATRGRQISAAADLDSARATLVELQLTIGGDVASAWASLTFAQQRVPIAESELKNATESLRIATGRFRAGVGAFITVTDAENSLVTAQQSLVSAQNGLATATANLRHAVGL